MCVFSKRQVLPVRQNSTRQGYRRKTRLDAAAISRENRYGLAARLPVPRPRRFMKTKDSMPRLHRLGILSLIVCAAILVALAIPSLRSRAGSAQGKAQTAQKAEKKREEG